MTRALPHSDLDKAFRRLRPRLRKLDGTNGRPIARRNARRAVLSAMSLLRAVVDRLYPAIVERKLPGKRLPGALRYRRMYRDPDWTEIVADKLAQYATAKITVKRVAWVETRTRVIPAGWDAAKHRHVPEHTVPVKDNYEHFFVPSWAAVIGPNVTALLAAKRSRTAQRAALATAALAQDGAS